jgi:hypothetical protein
MLEIGLAQRIGRFLRMTVAVINRKRLHLSGMIGAHHGDKIRDNHHQAADGALMPSSPPPLCAGWR